MHPEAISKTVLPSPHAPGPTLPPNLYTYAQRLAFSAWCLAMFGARCEWLREDIDGWRDIENTDRALAVHAPLGTAGLIRELVWTMDRTIRVLGVTS